MRKRSHVARARTPCVRARAPALTRAHARTYASTHARAPARAHTHTRTRQSQRKKHVKTKRVSRFFAAKPCTFAFFSVSRLQQDTVWKAAPSNITSITCITRASLQTHKRKAADPEPDPKTSPKTHPPDADDAGDAHHFPFHGPRPHPRHAQGRQHVAAAL